MTDTSSILGLPYLAEAQASAEVLHNESLSRIDSLAQIAVIDRDLATPPGSPAQGDCYLIATGGTGAWNGKDGQLTVYVSGWLFTPVKAGMLVYVRDENKLLLRSESSTWLVVPSAASLLANGTVSLTGGPQAVTTSYVTLGGLSVSLAAGTYLLLACIRVDFVATAYGTFKFRNVTDSADVGQLTLLSSNTGGFQLNATGFAVVTLAGTKTIEVQAVASVGSTITVYSTADGNTYFSWLKIG